MLGIKFGFHTVRLQMSLLDPKNWSFQIKSLNTTSSQFWVKISMPDRRFGWQPISKSICSWKSVGGKSAEVFDISCWEKIRLTVLKLLGKLRSIRLDRAGSIWCDFFTITTGGMLLINLICLPRGCQNEHKSQSSSPEMSFPPGWWTWKSCLDQGRWPGLLHEAYGGRRAHGG